MVALYFTCCILLSLASTASRLAPGFYPRDTDLCPTAVVHQSISATPIRQGQELGVQRPIKEVEPDRVKMYLRGMCGQQRP